MIVKLNDTNFDELTSTGVTLIDFYADWCGPCKRMNPILDSVANRLKDQVTVAKVNVDSSPNLSAKFGVRGIPMFVLVKDGKLLKKVTGSKAESELINFATST